MSLSPGERERYSRQLLLPGWDETAQRRLKRGAVLVVGMGALGSAAAQYLAAAGVGRLGIVDDDDVELSNLSRQILHYTPDVGVPKAASAASKLRYLNPTIVVEDYAAKLGRANAPALLVDQDVIVDCTDTFASRYAVNDACVAEGATLVTGAALGWEGTVMTIRPRETACWRCAFPRAPDPQTAPSCAGAGVAGAAAGVVGSLQAAEALKVLTGLGEPLTDRFLTLDVLAGRTEVVSTSRDPACRACGGE